MHIALELIVGLITSIGGMVLLGAAGVKLGEWCDRHGMRYGGEVLGGIFGIFGLSAGMLFAVYIFD